MHWTPCLVCGHLSAAEFDLEDKELWDSDSAVNKSRVFQCFGKLFLGKTSDHSFWDQTKEDEKNGKANGGFPFCEGCSKRLLHLWKLRQQLKNSEEDLWVSMNQGESNFETTNVYQDDERYFKIRRQILGEKVKEPEIIITATLSPSISGRPKLLQLLPPPPPDVPEQRFMPRILRKVQPSFLLDFTNYGIIGKQQEVIEAEEESPSMEVDTGNGATPPIAFDYVKAYDPDSDEEYPFWASSSPPPLEAQENDDSCGAYLANEPPPNSEISEPVPTSMFLNRVGRKKLTIRRQTKRKAAQQLAIQNGQPSSSSPVSPPEPPKRKNNGCKSTMNGNRSHVPCTVCGKPCVSSSLMKIHRWSHLNQREREEATSRGEKPLNYQRRFQCEFCSNIYSRKDDLYKHQVKFHGPMIEEKNFCPTCKFWVVELDQHMHLMHDAKFTLKSLTQAMSSVG